MEHTLVAILVLNIALATGSVLHTSGAPIQHLLPYEVTYSNGHSPILLTQPLGLSVEQVLAAAHYAQVPAPVAETSSDDGNGNGSNIDENSINQAALGPSLTIIDAASATAVGEAPAPAPEAASISLEQSAATSNGQEAVGSGLPAPLPAAESAPPAAAPESPSLTIENRLSTPASPGSIAAGELPSPSAAPESPSPSPAAESPLPAPETPLSLGEELPPATDAKLLDSITRGAFYIDANGKLQMQASYISGGEALQVVATELPQPVGAVPVVVPELPVLATVKASKSPGLSNVNVNVNVHVNGDGTGSAFNATPIAKINAPSDLSKNSQ